MGFHIPDMPSSPTYHASIASSSNAILVETRSVSVSVGTSMADEDVDSPPPPAPRTVRRQQRRNAMIPILAAQALAAQNPEGVVPTDATQALLQFQQQLRSRGLLPPADQAPKQPANAAESTATASAGTTASASAVLVLP